MYADYSYYSGAFGGLLVPEADFGRLAGRAARRMDEDSGGRAAGFAQESFVKDCCCAVVEELYILEGARMAGGIVKSEARGKVSVVYDTQGAAGKHSEKERIMAVERRYLGPWGLVYHGG